MLIDAHCHLQDKRIADRLAAALERAQCAGVEKMICCGTTESDWTSVLRFGQLYPAIHPAIGLHPWYIAERSTNWLQSLEQLLRDTPRAAIGEIGLDHAIDDLDREDQERVFLDQLALARRLHRPVTIHCRRAWQALIKIIDETGPLPDGWMVHAYSGSLETMRELIRRRAYISLAASVTRRQNRRVRAVAAEVPDDRLLIETDAPDIIPYVLRGSQREYEPVTEGPNLPEYLVYIADEIAALRNTDRETISAITTRNALRLFG